MELFGRMTGAEEVDSMSVEVTEATFTTEVEGSPMPVVLEFYATWCGNCRRIAPVLDALAEEFAPGVRFVKVNADEEPGLVSRFGVSSTPTLFVLDGGQQVTSIVGAQPAPVLRALFETASSSQDSAGSPAGSGCGCGSGCASMPVSTAAASPVPSPVGGAGWVPDACTLPTADQPMRLAEFDTLFRSSLTDLRREEPGWLRLRLQGGDDAERVAEQARDLTVREAECCSFFDFTVDRDGSDVVVDVRVPADKVVVLDGLAAQAQAARSARV
ncbi:thioredoxin fold domain-containing protein [Saccharopolyspora endophytica]|uniref:Thioredoxin fold domain-containing protein n=1 Tax=Saccharopolyspora endophytica TaxID=543886 RepID=A0ABS5DHM7_9PSEU|nr:thioredoxin fold domain-containing protein [Saccharopolyspora endophytica]